MMVEFKEPTTLLELSKWTEKRDRLVNKLNLITHSTHPLYKSTMFIGGVRLAIAEHIAGAPKWVCKVPANSVMLALLQHRLLPGTPESEVLQIIKEVYSD